jgi:hypothetical protein
MSFQKAVNEIASLLTQGGIPSNHAGDIAARLTNAITSHYDSRQSSGGSREVTSSSSRSAAFRNAFRSSEEYPGGTPGAAGADGQGAYAWATGQDGKDGTGQDGTSGQDGASGRDGASGVGVGIDIGAIKKLIEDALKGKDGKDATAKCKTGKFSGLEICSILDQQAIEIGKLRRELDTFKDAVKAIEKQLKDTVEC